MLWAIAGNGAHVRTLQSLLVIHLHSCGTLQTMINFISIKTPNFSSLYRRKTAQVSLCTQGSGSHLCLKCVLCGHQDKGTLHAQRKWQDMQHYWHSHKVYGI